LDENCYPGLDREILDASNVDQVVSKEYRRVSGRQSENIPILMVPQIWIWKFNGVLLTAYSMSRSSPAFRNVPAGVLPQLRSDDQRHPITVNMQIGLILASQIKSFARNFTCTSPGAEQTFKPPLDMFEAALMSTMAAVHQYLKADRTTLTTQEQKQKEYEFIHLVSDIHSELDMIQSVLDQQKMVLDDLFADSQESADADNRRLIGQWMTVKRARDSLDQHTVRIVRIHKDAERVEKTIESFLNLQRTYATIEDTQNNMLVGLAALAFAIVTVIFTPLSFMTSLLAFPLRQVAVHQETITIAKVPVRIFKGWYVGLCTGTIITHI
jgi:hypothetical protein